MTKLAFIDIDRIVSNGDARFALAEEARQQVLAMSGTNRDATNEYWRVAFTPEHIALDEMIEGAYDALNKIEEQGYEVIFLTSRPERLRAATLNQLDTFRIRMGRDLVMKPAVNQYHKTREWKVWAIHLIAGMYTADEILVIDDEQANLDELARVPASWVTRVYTSLEMKALSNDLDDIRPF